MLDPDLVMKARQEKLGHIRKHNIYKKVPRAMCLRESGKQPVNTGWAETNKRDA